MSLKQSLLLFATAFGVAVATSQPVIAKVCKPKITKQTCGASSKSSALVGVKGEISRWSKSARQKYGLLYWNWDYANHRKAVVFERGTWCARVSGNPCRTFRPLLILRPHPGTAPVVPKP
jgi:hypothetical protein